jgi:hypothetical protein
MAGRGVRLPPQVAEVPGQNGAAPQPVAFVEVDEDGAAVRVRHV